jgi:prevent-host-death family protein
MKTYDIEDAKAQLSQLIDRAAKGEPFIMSINGKPMVQVTAVEVDEAPKKVRRLGFMSGQIQVPDDFNTIFAAEIQAMFEGDPDESLTPETKHAP